MQTAFIAFVLSTIAAASAAHAQSPPTAAAAQKTTIACESRAGEKHTCDAYTAGGVALLRSVGTSPCDFGVTWGSDATGIWVANGCSAEFSIAVAPVRFARYTPTGGFKVADTEYGDLNIRLFTYIRYLSQRFVDESYTNAFGTTSDIQQRQDFQVNKMQVYFFGWLFDPKFRYLSYVWTSNTSLGQTSQVVVAGNLTYKFSDYFTLGAGISGLPGVRTTEGNFPYWLGIDARLIADEYLRPSYTTGIFADGAIADGLTYRVMLGNNLSQFGIDAGQLDSSPDTLAVALAWMPTTGEFGRQGGFGDFEPHEDPATRVAVHYTRSNENRQSQPNTDAFDNVQLRVSDGSVIFTNNLFAPGVQIDEATYQMIALDGGVKYEGISADAEFYWRRMDNFTFVGALGLPFAALHDHGLQLQGSAMVMEKQLQVYAGMSKVFGEYGNPRDFRAGVTLFPWKNEVVRWNAEFIDINRSPVGASSLPYSVGMTGPVFHSSFMLWF